MLKWMIQTITVMVPSYLRLLEKTGILMITSHLVKLVDTRRDIHTLKNCQFSKFTVIYNNFTFLNILWAFYPQKKQIAGKGMKICQFCGLEISTSLSDFKRKIL